MLISVCILRFRFEGEVLRGMGILGLVGFLLILVFQLRVPWTLLDGVIMA